MIDLKRRIAQLKRPVDAAGLAIFRILFGLLACFSSLRFIAKGWVSELYLEPAFHFTYYGFEWVKPWPAPLMYLHMGLMAGLALAISLGYRTRISAFGFALLFSYAELIDKAIYLNHYYLVSLLALLIGCLPTHAVWSIDAWRSARASRERGAAPASTSQVPFAAYFLLRAQIAIVYLYAGIAKINSDWLFYAEPVRTWLRSRVDTPFIGPLLGEPFIAFAMSWGGLFFDLSVVLLLSWRKTRGLAWALALLFHLSIWYLFPVGMFSFVMLLSISVFSEPDWPRRAWGKLQQLIRARRGEVAQASAEGTAGGQPQLIPASMYSPREASNRCVTERLQREPAQGAQGPKAYIRLASWKLYAAGAYLLLQALLPSRHLLYPGDGNWTEQGFRFAWRVMLIEKAGHVSFIVKSQSATQTGVQELVVSPKEHLTPLQQRMLATQPDMILSYAHYLKEKFEQLGYREVKIYAQTQVAYNGRLSQPLIDPEVDLASERHSFLNKPWILPLTAGRAGRQSSEDLSWLMSSLFSSTRD